MPTPTATAADFCRGLTRSQLVPGVLADRALRQFYGGGGEPADVDAFRKYVVAHLGLTEYQAALIQRGRSDGFQIGGYTVLDRIGKGATGGVYKAAHPSGQLVAVKVLPGSKAADPHTLERFRREGRLLTQLDHPNVVRAFEVGEAGPVRFIVMEYLDGEALDHVVLRRGKLPAPEAVRLARQALLGLQHLHDRRIIHRDLKPANLMVTPGGGPTTLAATLKLLDVGIGRELADAPELPPDFRLTAAGSLLGTPSYLPPEQARDPRSAGPASDQYGLGCVLFHLIAGHPPFTDLGELALLLRHATDAPDRLPDAPAGLQAVIDRMTAKDPQGRYPSCEAAAAALAPYQPAGAVETDTAAVVPTDRVRPKGAGGSPRSAVALTRRDLLMVGVGAVAALAAVGGGTALMRWGR